MCTSIDFCFEGIRNIKLINIKKTVQNMFRLYFCESLVCHKINKNNKLWLLISNYYLFFYKLQDKNVELQNMDSEFQDINSKLWNINKI